jgi:hypothetical protein
MPTSCLPRLEREAAIDDLLAGDEVGFGAAEEQESSHAPLLFVFIQGRASASYCSGENFTGTMILDS